MSIILMSDVGTPQWGEGSPSCSWRWWSSPASPQGCPEEERLEENGSKGDCFQKKCGEIWCHKLCIFLFKTMVLMFLSRCYVFHIFKPPLFYFEKKTFPVLVSCAVDYYFHNIKKSKRTANYILKNQARRQQCQSWDLGYSFASPWSLRVECSWRKKRKFKRIS